MSGVTGAAAYGEPVSREVNEKRIFRAVSEER